ncbi:NADH-quinone oxidoreductase subunit J [Paenarthrobacter sp. Z7-10]|uniref:NADH-quinone oxidoreductase subunit J family protein n=1 Tax=Paenarthrobacter sp. Z7-10 TaxID=2787635 RepID=UPI0022A8E6A1|nr:NADH-quinone oxidoreductase subunit J [Paenarthrobacter sp. Z7-10]MCZ2402539.1 NADH-quinone oxidoreductase subunit J [Paenarthrobacter sp. Z7-10]
MLEGVIFGICALGAVVAGITVFRVDSMARATFALLASFLFAAVPILLLGLSYLGILVVLMMVMEMLIMAVFMVMYMMNPAGLMPMKMVHNNKASIGIAVAVFVMLAAGVLLTPWPAAVTAAKTAAATTAMGTDADPTLALGMDLMGPHMLVMIVIGMVLFATMVAVVVLATDRGRYERFGDDLRRRSPDDPVRGGLGR